MRRSSRKAFDHTHLIRDSIAMMRDTSKVVALGRGQPTFAKAEIRVYSSAGEGLLLFSVLTCLNILEFPLIRDVLFSLAVVPGKNNQIWLDA